MSSSHQKLGSWGETLAARFLEEKGFTILEKNFRAERGEIDLICKDENCIVFVEVKTRRSPAYGPPETSITPSKQRQLYKIAQAYIATHPTENMDYRFDVVVIDGTPQHYEIRYYPDAFML